jgi:hypothetical protein
VNSPSRRKPNTRMRASRLARSKTARMRRCLGSESITCLFIIESARPRAVTRLTVSGERTWPNAVDTYVAVGAASGGIGGTQAGKCVASAIPSQPMVVRPPTRTAGTKRPHRARRQAVGRFRDHR